MSEPAVSILRLKTVDADAWLAMRAALWPKEDRSALAGEMTALFAREDFAVFGARTPSGAWVGFLEIGARDVAEGCESSPVGYVEGLWVDAPARRSGVARRLVQAAANWSRTRGYREMASDTEIDNTLSQAVHNRLGFEETERLVTFRMSLNAD
jgi:aminoglycoside 6'-N-acetyltransferase I